MKRAIRPACEHLEGRRLLAVSEFDPSFAGDGSTIVDFGFTESANATVVTPEGKTIVVGSVADGTSDFAIARLNIDGTLDTTFSGDGKQVAALGGDEDVATSVALLDNGDMIVAGYSSANGVGANSHNFVVIRVLSNGTIDNTFAGGLGKATIDFGFNDRATGVAIQADGKIVVGGFDDGGSADFAVARLTAGGVLDTTFNDIASPTQSFGDGKYAVNFGAVDKANAIAIHPNGKIILAGTTSSGGGAGNANNFALLSLNSNGTTDSTFNGNGRRAFDFGFDDQATGVVVRPDGLIIAGGFSDTGTANFATAAFKSDGTLDTSFNATGDTPGTAVQSMGGVEKSMGMAMRGDWGIVLTGFCTVGGGTTPNIAVMQLRKDGSPDNSFHAGGYVLLDTGGIDNILATALMPDGRVIAVGNQNNNMLVTRIQNSYPSGSGDGLFNDIGLKVNDFGTAETASAVAVQKDGKIVVAFTSGNASSDIAVARYNMDGSLDKSFSGDGIALASVGGIDVATSIVIQPDGKIVVGGYSNSTGGVGANDFVVWRLSSDGTNDFTFNNNANGLKFVDFGYDDRATAVAMQGDKIVVSGYADGGNADFAAARLNSNGTLDTTFNDIASPGTGNGDGRISFTFDPGGGFGGVEKSYAMVVKPTGEIVMGGSTTTGATPTNFAVAQLTSAGKLDSTFSGDGLAVFSFGTNEVVRAMTLTQDGVLVAGNDASNVKFFKVRDNGTFDDTFSSVPWEIDYGLVESATGIAEQPGGKIVVTGHTTTQGSRLFAARFNYDGNPDLSFHYGNEDVLWKLGTNTTTSGMTLDGDGRIIIAGTTTYATTSDLAVVRLLPGQYPAITSLITAPGIVEAENFDNGGEGVAYHDETNFNSSQGYRASGVDIGHNISQNRTSITDIRKNEWIEYSVFATAQGTYSLYSTLSSPAGGGSMRFELDGAAVPGEFGIPNTGDILDFIRLRAAEGLNMTIGYHTLRVIFEDAPAGGYNFNLDSFEFVRTGSINGLVLHDVNGNGTADPSDPSLTNWVVYDDANNSGTLDVGEKSVNSDAFGGYTLANLEAGTHIIREVLQSGYRITVPSAGRWVVVMSAGTTFNSINFLNTQKVLISGTAYSDFNTNGTLDAGENKIANWTVYLDTNNNGAADAGEPATLTDASGNYSFGSQSAGTYFVKQILQSTWRKTQPVQGTPGYTFTLANGQASTANFGNTHQALASGTVFNDINGNGVKDGGEVGLQNVRVYDDSNNNGAYDVGELFLMTDANGLYRTSLPAATYRGRVQVPAGKQQTSPLNPPFYLSTLTQGQTVGNANFGLKTIPPAPAMAVTSQGAILTDHTRYRLGFFDE